MAVTSTTATTAIDVCNRALVLIGASPMTSFEDGTNEALVAVNLYEDTCRSTLVNTRWRFASNQKILNRLSDEPTGRFDSAYSLPSDAIFNLLVVNPLEFVPNTIFSPPFAASTRSPARDPVTWKPSFDAIPMPALLP